MEKESWLSYLFVFVFIAITITIFIAFVMLSDSGLSTSDFFFDNSHTKIKNGAGKPRPNKER